MNKPDDIIETQIRHKTYVDLAHRLGSPLCCIQGLAVSSLRHELTVDQLRSSLRLIFAESVRMKMEIEGLTLLTKLQLGLPLQPVGPRLSTQDLLNRVIVMVEFFKLMTPPDRQLRWAVDREAFNQNGELFVQIDLDLFEFIIYQVMKNASQYSFAQTEVHISASRDSSCGFEISVENDGIGISSEEIKKCTERGWRGKTAYVVTCEGRGFGLWTVKNVLEVYGARLEIQSVEYTNAHFHTTIRMILRLHKT